MNHDRRRRRSISRGRIVALPAPWPMDTLERGAGPISCRGRVGGPIDRDKIRVSHATNVDASALQSLAARRQRGDRVRFTSTIRWSRKGRQWPPISAND